MRKQTRSPLLNTLRNALKIARYSKKNGDIPADELIEMQEEKYLKRRRFVSDILKTGIAVSAAGVLNACQKVTEIIPPGKAAVSNAARKSSQPRIIIVGGGMAGLNCAYQLKKSGFDSTVYEGASRIGGRIFTANNILAQGLYTELGGEFIDTDHTDILQLCHEFDLPLIDTRNRAEEAYLRDSFYIDGRFYTEAEVIKAFQPYAARIDADINSLPDIISYDDHDATTVHFDNMSLATYLDSIGMHGFIRKGIETAYLTEYGLETNIQSSINFLYLFSPDTSEGFDIFGSSDERYKIQGGNQRLTNAIYKEVSSQVRMQHKLVKIAEASKGYTLYFSIPGGTTESINADIVALTIPFSVLREVEIKVSLPSWKKNAIEKLGYGTNSKLLLGFNERVWRKYKYSGYVFTDKAIQTGWDNSWGQPGKSGGFTVYGGGNKGLALGEGTPVSQAPQFIDQLDKMWPGCKKAFNGNVNRMHWPSYPFTKGSYSCFKVGQYTTIRGAEIKPVGNIFFAGEHCSAEYQGFMNGAAETGNAAAKSIVRSIKSNAYFVTK